MDSIADSLAALSLLVAIGSLVYQQRRQRAWEKKQEARQYPEIEVMSDPLFQQDHPTWLDVASTMTLRLRAAGQDRATHISVCALWLRDISGSRNLSAETNGWDAGAVLGR